jgi:hypothetical protein
VIDFPVLAEDALEIAVAEEDCAGAAAADQRAFLAEMRMGRIDFRA